MNRDKLTRIYRDMLYVTLGPFARQLPVEGWKGRAVRWLELLVYTGKLLKDQLLYRDRLILPDGERVAGKVWLLAGSKNNRDSLAFLEESLDNSIMIAFNKKTAQLGDYPRLSFHQALFYFRKALSLYRSLWPDFREMLYRRPDEFLKAVGKYEAAIQILEKHRPKALIFTNDHVPEMRAMLWAGKALGILTVYIQHASVSTYFPNLKFDLSLLEGEDSLEKYRRCGPIEGEVQLIGMPKFDAYLPHRNLSREVRRIGLCANILDDQQLLEGALRQLAAAFPDCHLSFRPHPNDSRAFELPGGAVLSRSGQESIFDFLKQQDLIVAGDTSTHLEAVLLNVYSIYYPFNRSFSDYYSYVRNGLVVKADSLAQLTEMIRQVLKNRPAVVQRARYYNAVVGTERDGKSGELAVGFIERLLEEYPPSYKTVPV